eukprot:TRINITY_DN5835_c0_g3_i1.p1 TRINITY_DN5835_c0_g3~~TRINITY_DN5835_c0_g3_i1.p1  ORF type:complete len:428 (+),score=103.99 TRINITY_DN5835_c0_g3_i1:392-1675(+)
MAKIFIGTSGWHYKHWRGPYYAAKCPPAKMFQHYAQDFDTVEINNSFYKLPTKDTMLAWRHAAPENFLFTAKASKFITHNKKLLEPRHTLENLLPVLTVLQEKLGPILFQLPPKWRSNPQRLDTFLSALPRQHRYTFEFREQSWICDDVLAVLRKHNAAFCIYQLAGYSSPLHVTSEFVYVRLHGPAQSAYNGSYSPAALQEWAQQIMQWHAQGLSVYVYFDNDQAGYAAKNALTLKQLVAAMQGDVAATIATPVTTTDSAEHKSEVAAAYGEEQTSIKTESAAEPQKQNRSKRSRAAVTADATQVSHMGSDIAKRGKRIKLEETIERTSSDIVTASNTVAARKKVNAREVLARAKTPVSGRGKRTLSHASAAGMSDQAKLERCDATANSLVIDVDADPKRSKPATPQKHVSFDVEHNVVIPPLLDE